MKRGSKPIVNRHAVRLEFGLRKLMISNCKILLDLDEFGANDNDTCGAVRRTLCQSLNESLRLLMWCGVIVGDICGHPKSHGAFFVQRLISHTASNKVSILETPASHIHTDRNTNTRHRPVTKLMRLCNSRWGSAGKPCKRWKQIEVDIQRMSVLGHESRQQYGTHDGNVRFNWNARLQDSHIRTSKEWRQCAAVEVHFFSFHVSVAGRMKINKLYFTTISLYYARSPPQRCRLHAIRTRIDSFCYSLECVGWARDGFQTIGFNLRIIYKGACK